MPNASRILLALAACLALSRPAAAQRTISHDILTGETPTALTCGFCAGEKFGVLFRDLPGAARGLEPSDFPIRLDSVQIAIASADVIGSAGSYTCRGSTLGGSAALDVHVYAGTTLPESDIRSLSETDPWPGETLVFEGVELDLQRSAADAEGSSSYEVNFNALLFGMDGEDPIVIDPPNLYVRVAVSLTAGTDLTSASCAGFDPPLDPPAAFPLRDDDGVIAEQRAFIFASGTGWLWNETPGLGINGDWGIRIEVTDMGSGPSDGGPSTRDGGTPDAGERDGGGALDAGSAFSAGGGGCECGVVARGSRARGTFAALAVVVLALRRWRRARGARRA